MKTTEAVTGKWDLVFKYYNLPPITGNRHFKGKCPICGSKDDFRIDNKDGKGTYICVCGSGNGWKLLELTQNKTFNVLAKEIDQIIGNTPTITKTLPTQKDNLRTKVIRKFERLPEIKDTQAKDYFKNRFIDAVAIENVKYSAKERNGFGAIYSLATDHLGNVCYLHRTILDGDKKANIDAPKLLTSLQESSYLDQTHSVAIRLFKTASTLGIAEGIETALSCHQIYKCSTWSALNASLMKRFRAPAGVDHLIIFADSDDNGAGLNAAFECGHKNIMTKNDVKKVTIRWPNKGDFNDFLKSGGDVFEWVLIAKQS